VKIVGILFGMENTFPGALVERINAMELDDVRAEFVQVGGVQMTGPSRYAVIVDRISHEMAFYRAMLKNAVLTGTHVINNPFWWSADDKFFNYSLAAKLGIAVPHTVLLPHKQFPPHINDQSVRNLEFPLDWEAIFDYVGFPAFLKPHDGGGWRDVFHVRNAEDFFAAYDCTRDLCMVLQAEIQFEQYVRCYVVGRQEVRLMPYDPLRPHEERYVKDAAAYEPELARRIESDALTLCRALGYDLNTVEFAVHDGVPYAIDFMNPAPDADRSSIGEEHFAWIVDAVARLAVRRAREPQTAMEELGWAHFLTEKGKQAGPPAPRVAEKPARPRRKTKA
jgi:hypothetical protein